MKFTKFRNEKNLKFLMKYLSVMTNNKFWHDLELLQKDGKFKKFLKAFIKESTSWNFHPELQNYSCHWYHKTFQLPSLAPSNPPAYQLFDDLRIRLPALDGRHFQLYQEVLLYHESGLYLHVYTTNWQFLVCIYVIRYLSLSVLVYISKN